VNERRGADGGGELEDLLVERLRRIAAQLDPVPESLGFAARELLTWRRVDAELAELLSDSELDEAQPAAVRGDRGTRALSFEADGLTIELDVLLDGTRRRLVGQLVPPAVASIELQTAAERQTLSADSHGRFHAEGLAAGRLRLRVSDHPASSRPVETSWITI
jgi:hypothetical protein